VAGISPVDEIDFNLSEERGTASAGARRRYRENPQRLLGSRPIRWRAYLPPIAACSHEVAWTRTASVSKLWPIWTLAVGFSWCAL